MTQDFYHYTSKKGLNKILKSGCISESLSGGQDAKFGEGVYGTSLHPDEGKKQIAKNNWGQYWWKNKTSGKVDTAVHLKIPPRNLERADCDRDILLHRGPIFLEDYDHRIIQMGEHGERGGSQRGGCSHDRSGSSRDGMQEYYEDQQSHGVQGNNGNTERGVKNRNEYGGHTGYSKSYSRYNHYEKNYDNHASGYYGGGGYAQDCESSDGDDDWY
ncbi:hypothetical protein BaRGS_00007903 [Batillaria attramentaria]|uniref:Tox-ART-HYD1 domain-containing protein n=1 Tax=Batillaria attramentaria TaxID=370345 RepID=A0ABD0LNG7_9CAEN